MKLFGFARQNYLLRWQKAIVVNSPDKLLYTEAQLTKMTEGLVANDVRIITESLDIIAATKNADTRKSRQKVLAERIRHLEMLNPFVHCKYKDLIVSAKQFL